MLIAHVGICIIISVNHHHIVINKSFLTIYEDFLIDYAHWNLSNTVGFMLKDPSLRGDCFPNGGELLILLWFYNILSTNGNQLG